MIFLHERLLKFLPSYFDKQSNPLLIFTITSSGILSSSIDFDAKVLRIKKSIDEVDIDLTGLTIGQVKALLTVNAITFVTKTDTYDNLGWYTLAAPDSKGNFYYEQSLNRRIFCSVAQWMNDCYADFSDGVDEIYFYKSRGFWLDLWGSKFFAINRYIGESDEAYLARIKYQVLSLKTNNLALSLLLKHSSGIWADIVDMGASSQTSFIMNAVGSVTNSNANAGDLLFSGLTGFSSAHNTFGVYFHSGNFNNFDTMTKQIILDTIAKFKAAGCFPVFYAPANMLITNKAGNNLNSASYLVARIQGGWSQISIIPFQYDQTVPYGTGAWGKFNW